MSKCHHDYVREGPMLVCLLCGLSRRAAHSPKVERRGERSADEVKALDEIESLDSFEHERSKESRVDEERRAL